MGDGVTIVRNRLLETTVRKHLSNLNSWTTCPRGPRASWLRWEALPATRSSSLLALDRASILVHVCCALAGRHLLAIEAYLSTFGLVQLARPNVKRGGRARRQCCDIPFASCQNDVN